MHRPSRTKLLATYSRRTRMEKGLFERWKRTRPWGIVPKLLTAGGQPCYRWHVLAIGRPASEREVETGGRRPWDTGRGTETALLNSHPIDTLSSRGMCESIGTKHAKYRCPVTTSMMLKVDTLVDWQDNFTGNHWTSHVEISRPFFNEEGKICNIPWTKY